MRNDNWLSLYVNMLNSSSSSSFINYAQSISVTWRKVIARDRVNVTKRASKIQDDWINPLIFIAGKWNCVTSFVHCQKTFQLKSHCIYLFNVMQPQSNWVLLLLFSSGFNVLYVCLSIYSHPHVLSFYATELLIPKAKCIQHNKVKDELIAILHSSHFLLLYEFQHSVHCFITHAIFEAHWCELWAVILFVFALLHCSRMLPFFFLLSPYRLMFCCSDERKRKKKSQEFLSLFLVSNPMFEISVLYMEWVKAPLWLDNWRPFFFLHSNIGFVSNISRGNFFCRPFIAMRLNQIK